jgi:FtsP/CotA-like multicopper oxidase with cupredoxin domain
MGLTRRDLLRMSIAAGGAAMLPTGRRILRADDLPPSPNTTPFLVELPIAPIALDGASFPTQIDPGNCVNVDGTTAFHVGSHGPNPLPLNTKFFIIHEREFTHSFHPQLPPNSVWGYDGKLPGPTFIATTGTPFLVRFVNDLPVIDPVGIGEPISAVHRHSGFQAPEDDGYPLDTFCTGQSRDFFFPNRPDNGLVQSEHSTLWYHDHAIDITAQNVYRGLAGFFLNFDALDSLAGEEDPSAGALKLPGRMRTVTPPIGAPFKVRDFDIPLVIQDKQFDGNGFLVYDNFDHNGFLGDKFLVNGKIQPFLRVKRRKYRFRFLNGSSARIYEFFLRNGVPFDFVIATDAHLFEHPIRNQQSFQIAPAERVEVVIDFSRYAFNDEIVLENRLEQTDGRKPDGIRTPGTPILKFIVDGNAADPSQVPDTLRPLVEGPAQLLPQVKVQRRFKFERSDGAWVINGQFFDENRINARPKVEQPEIWILESGGGWRHPVHIHLSEFFILSRDGKRPPVLERGRKDTVQIGADVGEVKILIKFAEFTGRYVFHCHNIDHEDMRMMAQFEVQP